MKHVSFGLAVRWSLCFMGSLSFLVSIFMLRALDHDPQPNDLLRRHTEVLLDDWPHDFIHIINTRFMQHQGDLVDLARARLILFDTFCLGSILGQSLLRKGYDTPPFLWIIKTDPDLDESILKELINMIESYPFIYLVASNVNYGIGIHPGGWRGGEAGMDVLQSQVYSGNMTLFRQAHAARESRAILETRLDADDGLHVYYLETIQEEARARLKCSSRPTRHRRQTWMYWCPLNHMDWSPTPPFAPLDQEYGVFLPIRSSHTCITAGITLGVSVGQQEDDIPRFMHHELYDALRVNKTRATCNGDKCLRMISKPILSAIRSRTATSAGMRGVVAGNNTSNATIKQMNRFAVPITNDKLVSALELGFHVSLNKTTNANRYMQQHVGAIAADNLRGQCQHGHSCKNSTRKALEELVRAAGMQQ